MADAARAPVASVFRYDAELFYANANLLRQAGLVDKKTGEPVSDYEKKFGHYVAHKAKRGSQKVA